MSAGGAAGAAAGAAAARRRREQEEEEMTSYSKEDLADDWEFKILRSNTGVFRKPERMRAILEEEARAGWVLVEKFDTGRIRLKRPRSARAADATLNFDPYRTQVGMSDVTFVLMIVGSTLGGIGLAIFVMIMIVKVIILLKDFG